MANKPEAIYEPRKPATEVKTANAPSSVAPLKTEVPPNMRVLFCYGTLKKDGALHNWLDGSVFLGDGLACGYSLVSLGPFPALVQITHKDQSKLLSVFKTAGELWAVPNEVFDKIEDMERKAGYSTEEIDVVGEADGSITIKASTFLFDKLIMGTSDWYSFKHGATGKVSGGVVNY
jgi:gamma-glutamylcyclotransferase (GGCT)/AIG2-like uncharacterized protein YtfP